jgi:hypothetical protein
MDDGAYELIPSRHELPTEEYPLIPEPSTPVSTWERTAQLRVDAAVVAPR